MEVVSTRQTTDLISNMKLFQTDRTFTAISWDSLHPELRKFLYKCLHCFSLSCSQVKSRMVCSSILAHPPHFLTNIKCPFWHPNHVNQHL
nr:hypothetical protein Iba_chr09cCG13640 [Ipomoea batatas]